METVIEIGRKANPGGDLTVLDIGTGSGVLAIAAALAGADKVVAIDTDPMACREAQINIGLNGVSGKICLVAGDMSVLKDRRFDLVLANLRGPTLKRILERISTGMTTWGVGVFSGFRSDESPFIPAVLRPPHWKKIWEAHSRGWAAMAVQCLCGRESSDKDMLFSGHAC
jgi:ribosomal protein L11 methyltransferase